jgi:hypothetical protein
VLEGIEVITFRTIGRYQAGRDANIVVSQVNAEIKRYYPSLLVTV